MVEWHPGELYPRVGFIVTNMSRPAERVVAFYNKRGTCEQWIMEGLMPDSIRLRRNKVGFVSPINTWIRGPLNCWVRDACASQSFLESPVWNGPRVRSLVNQAVVGQKSIEPVWPIPRSRAVLQDAGSALSLDQLLEPLACPKALPPLGCARRQARPHWSVLVHGRTCEASKIPAPGSLNATNRTP